MEPVPTKAFKMLMKVTKTLAPTDSALFFGIRTVVSESANSEPSSSIETSPTANLKILRQFSAP